MNRSGPRISSFRYARGEGVGVEKGNHGRNGGQWILEVMHDHLSKFIAQVLFLLAACGSPEPEPPTADEIVAGMTASMNALNSFHFVIDYEGSPAYVDPEETLSFRGAEGDYLAPDRARAIISGSTRAGPMADQSADGPVGRAAARLGLQPGSSVPGRCGTAGYSGRGPGRGDAARKYAGKGGGYAALLPDRPRCRGKAVCDVGRADRAGNGRGRNAR